MCCRGQCSLVEGDHIFIQLSPHRVGIAEKLGVVIGFVSIESCQAPYTARVESIGRSIIRLVGNKNHVRRIVISLGGLSMIHFSAADVGEVKLN